MAIAEAPTGIISLGPDPVIMDASSRSIRHLARPKRRAFRGGVR